MDRWSVAVASFVIGVALSASPSLAEDAIEALPDIAAVPEYAVTPPRDFPDVKLATSGKAGSQAVAVNPKNSNVLLAAYAAEGTCWVRMSTNAGRTWAAAKKLPMPQGKRNCNVPALTWAPDGSRLYAAYSFLILDADSIFTEDAGVLVSSSTDRGVTWSEPTFAVRYTEPYEYYKVIAIKLATPLNDSRWIYVLSDVYDFDHEFVNFSRSDRSGRIWDTKTVFGYNERLATISSPSVAGGLGGQVLIAWSGYYYDDLEDETPTIKTEIVYSSDYGTAFFKAVVAVPDVASETAVAFGFSGTAHLMYAANYIYSTKAPYNDWSAPVALNDDPWAAYSPALTVSACGSGTSVLHAMWIDDRAGSGRYNAYYTRKVARTGENWSPNLRVFGTPLSPTYGYGLTAGIAAGVGNAVAVWGQSGRYSYVTPGPVYASRIAPGVSCP